MLDFRQMTLFCLGYRLSKHKKTICSKNLGGHCPLGPSGWDANSFEIIFACISSANMNPPISEVTFTVRFASSCLHALIFLLLCSCGNRIKNQINNRVN